MADQWDGKRKREKSLVIETSEALAFQNISTLVQAMESEAWGQTSKSQKTEDTLESLDLTASSSAIEVYQAPSLAIVPVVNFKFTFEELGVLSRDEVLPYVDTSRVRDDGIVKVNSAMFSRGAVEGAKEYPIDISVEGLKKLDAWKAIAPWFGFNLKNAQGRSEGWVVDDFRKFTLEKHPHGSVLDMRVRLVIRQREELKEELAKAQEQTALAARREEIIRLEKDALQKEYSRDKADWESKNHKLAEEVYLQAILKEQGSSLPSGRIPKTNGCSLSASTLSRPVCFVRALFFTRGVTCITICRSLTRRTRLTVYLFKLSTGFSTSRMAFCEDSSEETKICQRKPNNPT
ncbi:hypothetical protein R1sor_007208 [Riccia sorocarpa]|uniref:Uncharacterized protein n=1 Tax=Riccia sorocarpa TaxID=122646 RepID=A0ABD3HPS3_9MARC